MIWKIWKKSIFYKAINTACKLNSEKVWEIQNKGKLNSEKDMYNTDEK
jgi:hypothetical protein